MNEFIPNNEDSWEVFCKNFLDPLWEECYDYYDLIYWFDKELEEEEMNGYYVDPELLKGL